MALVLTPEGIAGEQIFQKHKQTLAIPHIRELDPKLDPGHAPLMIINSRDALIGTAQISPHSRSRSCIALVAHGGSDATGIDLARRAGPAGLRQDQWRPRSAPLDRLQQWDTVKAFAQAAAQHLADTLPKLFSAKMRAQNRHGRIYVDYLHNRHGATTVSAFSLRARPHLGVSVPIARSELADLQHSDQWRFDTLPQRLEGLKDDPWAGYGKVRQGLTAARRKRLGVD